MSRKYVSLAATLAFVIGASAPALAENDQPTNAKKARDPNEVVCEKQEVLGSRLGGKKVCKTRAEWAEQRRLDRLDVERVQTQRGSCDKCQ